MAIFWQSPVLQAAVFVAIGAALTGIAFYWVGKWRGDAEQDRPEASELLTKFRELHARGSLSDEEFRTIKTKLAAQLEQELAARNETKSA